MDHVMSEKRLRELHLAWQREGFGGPHSTYEEVTENMESGYLLSHKATKQQTIVIS